MRVLRAAPPITLVTTANDESSPDRGLQFPRYNAATTGAEIMLDRSSAVPLYEQIATPIAKLIYSKELAPGTRIEDEVTMAKRLQVSRPTARQALRRLVDQGLVVRRRGIGTRVAPALIHRPMELTSLFGDIEKGGHRATTTVLDYGELEASREDAEHLGLDAAGTPVTYIRRLRLADGEPIAIMTNLIPHELAPTREELEAGGLYEALRERNVHLNSARQSIGARNATTEEANLLGLKRGASLLTMQRWTIDQTGRVVEYGKHAYRADRYTFDSTVFTP